MNKIILGTLALVVTATSAAAQQPIDQTIPTSATGHVLITNTAGQVQVTAWDRNEIRVTGTLGQGAEGVEVGGSGDRTEIRVVLPRGGGRNIRGTTLEVRVPARKALTVTTTSADIRVEGVTGTLELRSTSGDVTARSSSADVVARSTSGDVTIDAQNATRVRATAVSGDVVVRGTVQQSVEAEAVSGDVEIRASTPEVRAKTVSGDLLMQGVSGRVTAASTSGSAMIRDSRIQFGSFESVSGDLVFDGELQRGAAFNVQTHSGNIEMRLPGSSAAEFEARTFSGRIVSELGGTVERTSARGPGQELRFTAGAGGGMIALKTFSGDVRLVRR